MTPTAQALAEVVALAELATPGPWRWSENGNIVPEPYTDVEIAAVYTERDDDLAPANAELIIAAVNFIRTHGPALLAQLGGGREVCEWECDEDDYSWASSCGEKYCFTEGGPEDNGHKFCHGCGHELKIAAPTEPAQAGRDGGCD
jgi:hypothetical protein